MERLQGAREGGGSGRLKESRGWVGGGCCLEKRCDQSIRALTWIPFPPLQLANVKRRQRGWLLRHMSEHTGKRGALPLCLWFQTGLPLFSCMTPHTALPIAPTHTGIKPHACPMAGCNSSFHSGKFGYRGKCPPLSLFFFFNVYPYKCTPTRNPSRAAGAAHATALFNASQGWRSPA